MARVMRVTWEINNYTRRCRGCGNCRPGNVEFSVWMPSSTVSEWIGFRCEECVKCLNPVYECYLKVDSYNTRYTFYDFETLRSQRPWLVPRLEKI